MTLMDATAFEQWRKIAESGDFEASLAALEQSVALLEQGGLSLAEMTDCYELGLKLSKRCSDLLRAAELRVTLLDREFADETVPDSLIDDSGSNEEDEDEDA